MITHGIEGGAKPCSSCGYHNCQCPAGRIFSVLAGLAGKRTGLWYNIYVDPERPSASYGVAVQNYSGKDDDFRDSGVSFETVVEALDWIEDYDLRRTV